MTADLTVDPLLAASIALAALARWALRSRAPARREAERVNAALQDVGESVVNTCRPTGKNSSVASPSRSRKG